MSESTPATPVRIATRQSLLALWQAEYVQDGLQTAHPGLAVELVKMKTQGDKILDTPLAKIGGKGLFVKELEQGMLEGRADLAVHSMKDVPVEFPEGLGLSVICKREDPRDAFVSNRFESIDALPQGARVGTSSLRRRCQILSLRPDLQVSDLRGNVQTRLGKLDAGEFDAIILASAGLIRLKLEDRIRLFIPPEVMLPAVGQGAVGIECRDSDTYIQGLISILHHPDTADRVRAERAMNAKLEGGCQVPIGAYAELRGENLDRIYLRGLVGSPDGKEMIRGEIEGPRSEAEALGTKLGADLLARGADRILAAVYGQRDT